MTDKELLELAAKAAGFEIDWREWITGKTVEFGSIKYTKYEGFWLGAKQWNPLTDDGDALRLAVKLKIDILFDFDRIIACYGDGEREYETEYLYDKPAIPDHDAVTRRAIVRAAAEVGKTMK
jgi:hypothetical protein